MNIFSCFVHRNARLPTGDQVAVQSPPVPVEADLPVLGLRQRAQQGLESPTRFRNTSSPNPGALNPGGIPNPIFANTRATLKALAEKFIYRRTPVLTLEKLKESLAQWVNSSDTPNLKAARENISQTLILNFSQKHSTLDLNLDSNVADGANLLPKEICLFTHLTFISIRTDLVSNTLNSPKKFNLKNLFANISNLPKLLGLAIYRIELNEIPDEVFRVKGLRSLTFSNCKINTVSKNIKKLKFLENLDLSSNNIKSLPREINDLESLLELRIEENSLKKLPQVNNLGKLSVLDISDNQLIELPRTIAWLQNLTSMNLSSNSELQNVPAGFFRLPSTARIQFDFSHSLWDSLEFQYEGAQWPELFPQVSVGALDWSATHTSFKTLEEATTFWRGRGQRESLLPETLNHWKSSNNSADFVKWLSRLRHCKDFSNISSRPALVSCINDLFEHLQSPEVNVAEVFTAVRDSLNKCTDRVLTGMKQVSLLQLRQGAAKAAHASPQTAMERGITEVLSIYLEQKAGLDILQRDVADPIETYLAYEKHLGKLFKHLYTAQNMAHESVSHVKPVDLWRMLRHLLSELNQEGLRTYLYEDSHWQKYFLSPIKQALKQADDKLSFIEDDIAEKNPDLNTGEVFETDAYKNALQAWKNDKANILANNQAFNMALKEYIPRSVISVIEKCQPHIDEYEALLSKPESEMAKLYEIVKKQKQEKENYEKAFKAAEEKNYADESALKHALESDKKYKELDDAYRKVHKTLETSQQALAKTYEAYGNKVWTPISRAIQALPVNAETQY